MQFIESLYDNNRCNISCGGKTFDGFPMKAGIRQGCPLSPLLLAVVADLLLRRLAKDLPDELFRAFADDTAMVARDWWSVAASVKNAFDEFALISGLHLNIPKTVVIPLWPTAPEIVQTRMLEMLPGWSNVDVASWSTYLGFATGPGKGSHSCDKPLLKYVDRLGTWPWPELGLQYAATAYNTYVASVLSFVGQLEVIPEHALQQEQVALRTVARGPGNWACAEDLWFLSENFNFPVSFAHLSISAWASQVRVATWEASSSGGLHVGARSLELSIALTASEFFDRTQLWGDWYRHSHILTLHNAVARVEAFGITARKVISDLTERSSQPRSQRGRTNVKKCFQREIRQRLLMRIRPDAEERIRNKLVRWSLPGVPRINADRTLRRLRGLRSLVPPRVFAAVFSTLFNRWCTARRFQRRASLDNRCVLGCSGRAEDSIEHYARCQILRDFARRGLNLHFGDDGALADWMMTTSSSDQSNVDKRTLMAVLVYSAYRATNEARAKGRVNEETAKQMLGQYVHEAVRDHAAAMSIVDKCWISACRGRPRQRCH
jgi:hypothetical protein